MSVLEGLGFGAAGLRFWMLPSVLMLFGAGGGGAERLRGFWPSSVDLGAWGFFGDAACLPRG